MQNTSKAFIHIERLRKLYQVGGRNICALNGFSVDIQENEFVAVVGKSGSGKTTLMNIIGGLDKPDSGHVHINGNDISNFSSKFLARFRNESIGFVFQQFNLLRHQTALENVMLPLGYRRPKFNNMRENATLALELVGLGERADHKPEELSGGQQQRVAIARALVGRPRLLLADEPTGSLDSKTSKELLELFSELHKSGLTIVIITHDNDVASYAQRVITLRDGKLVLDKHN